MLFMASFKGSLSAFSPIARSYGRHAWLTINSNRNLNYQLQLKSADSQLLGQLTQEDDLPLNLILFLFFPTYSLS